MNCAGNVVARGRLTGEIEISTFNRWRSPLIQIFRKYAWSFPAIAVLGLLASLLEGIGIGLLIPLVALLMASDIAHGLPEPIRTLAAITSGLDRQARVIVLGVAVAGFIVLKGLIQALNNMYIASLDGRIGRDIRNALVQHLFQLDYPFFMREDGSRLVHILSTDSWFVAEATRMWLAMMPAALALLVTAAILAWLNLNLFLVAMVGACAIQMGLLLLERRQRELGREATVADLMLWNRMVAVVREMRVIRLFGQQRREQDRFATGTERLRRATLGAQRLAGLLTPAIDGLLALLFLVIVLVGYRSGMSLPSMTAFLVLLVRAQPYALTVTQSRIGIAAVRRAVGEVEWLLEQEPPDVVRPALPAAPPLDRPIRFDEVSYVYAGSRPALARVSMTLNPGTATALLGRSGSGKTTLVNLLTRLIEPQRGTIRLGEQPIDKIDLDSWRSRIAVAGQDIELVEGTIAENIAYGRPGASQAEIAEVACTAGAADFIERLPEGYHTQVGEEGVRLSGGQRQRISLARALLRRPDLLILDEAMNAVDAISETEIMRLLSEHRDFRTALVVSHRKSTLSACSDGIVIEDGCVREAGPLATLAYFREMAGGPPAAVS